MKIQKNEKGNIAVFALGAEIRDMWQMMDRMAEAYYQGCFGLVVHKEDLPDGFFNLKNGVAGEILQKFSNYQMKIGIAGDFSAISSHALSCFISESNRGHSVFFLDSVDACVQKMIKAK
ncbi:MAG: DUF4180 domain-containing protein [Eubacteriales bacterium]